MLEVLALSPSPPWPLILASLASQLIFVVVAVVASGRIFRATLLLYGVRPSVRQHRGRGVRAVLSLPQVRRRRPD